MGYDPLRVVLLVACFLSCSRSTHVTSNVTQLYHDATIHYLDEEWQLAIDYFEELLIKWNEYQKNLYTCRRRCASNLPSPNNEIAQSLKVASCQLKCRPSFICDRTVEKDLRRNVPYNYLQLAYYKLNDLERAAASAYTYYLKNMDDAVAIANVKYFRAMPGIRDSYFKDRNLRPHTEIFASAPSLYSSMDSKADLLKKLADGFGDFLDDLDSCVAGCQKPVNREDEFDVDDGDLASNLGIHFAQFLNCTLFCEDFVSVVDGEYTFDYVLTYLLYLHSVSSEVGDEEIYFKTMASISMLDLSDDELMSLDISAEAARKSHSDPLPDFSNFISRKKETSFLSDLLLETLSDGDML